MRRREFIKMAAMGVPLFHIGCAGFGQGRRRQIAQGAKIRVALIGCGHRMGEIIQLVLAEKVVAMVDPDPACIAKLREKIAKIPGGSEAVAGSVDFSDYREMFDKMGDSVDAVFICTPNHHHALAAVWAMKRGIHVYVEKPMALNVAEAKYMQQLAKETGVTTQVGNFGHSTRAMALCVKALKEKVIGDIEDVWCYDDRVNALDHRPPASKPPEGMNWDAWVGPAPWVDYYGPEGKRKVGLHPHDFHCWQGVGNGSIGNMGTHIMDAPFYGLDLGVTPPTSVIAHVADFACEGSWSYRTRLEWKFPALGDRGPINLHWFDGLREGLKFGDVNMNDWGYAEGGRKMQYLPEALLKCERDYHLEKIPFASNGSLFVGTKGCIWFGHHTMVRFLPKTLGKDLTKRINWTMQSLEHVTEFYNAVREGREANRGFTFSTPLAESLLLGNVATLGGCVGKTLMWNGERITNDEGANQYLASTYRPGWELKG